MARHLGAAEAANEIRQVIMLGQAHIDPEAQHQMKFLKEVCRHLGMEPDAQNVHHVGTLLQERDIAISGAQEYPKYVTRKWDNSAHIVHSDKEADEKINEPPPEPAAPPPAAATGPVQDLSLDLKDKVPKMVPTDHATGRVPTELTDREAGQGQRLDLVQHHDDDNLGDHHADVGDQDGDGDVDGDDVVTFETDPDITKGEKAGDAVTKDAAIRLGDDDHTKGTQAHDDPDRDGVAGQDSDPTHDNAFVRHAEQDGTLNEPRDHADRASTDENTKARAREPARSTPPKKTRPM